MEFTRERGTLNMSVKDILATAEWKPEGDQSRGCYREHVKDTPDQVQGADLEECRAVAA